MQRLAQIRILAVPFAALIALMAGGSAANAAVVALYDGNGLPGDQAWLLYGTNDPSNVSQTTTPSGVQLQTSGSASAGYSNYVPFLNVFKNSQFPVLDAAKGFEMSFVAQINSESHSSNDRAGFSVILLGSDQKGVEIGFWENEIWAQTANPLFTHGSGVSFDTTVEQNYRLRVTGDSYTLLGGNQSLLSGDTMDYSAFGVPYSLPNYVFVGDNTSSAGADVVIGPIMLNSDVSAVPEPSGTAMILLSSLVVAWRRKGTARAAQR